MPPSYLLPFANVFDVATVARRLGHPILWTVAAITVRAGHRAIHFAPIAALAPLARHPGDHRALVYLQNSILRYIWLSFCWLISHHLIWIKATGLHVARAQQVVQCVFGSRIAQLVADGRMVQIAAHLAHLGARATGLGALHNTEDMYHFVCREICIGYLPLTTPCSSSNPRGTPRGAQSRTWLDRRTCPRYSYAEYPGMSVCSWSSSRARPALHRPRSTPICSSCSI